MVPQAFLFVKGFLLLVWMVIYYFLTIKQGSLNSGIIVCISTSTNMGFCVVRKVLYIHSPVYLFNVCKRFIR